MRIAKWLAVRIIDVGYLMVTGITGRICNKVMEKYKKKLLKKNGPRIKRKLEKYLRRYTTARNVCKALRILDYVLAVAGASIGSIAVYLIDRYIDPQIGYGGKRNNHYYIFG